MAAAIPSRNSKRERRSNKPTLAWIGLSKRQSGSYAELVTKTFRISLGRIDHTHPTSILDVCLAKAPELQLHELRQLLIADKHQRDVNRPRGRPRRQQP